MAAPNATHAPDPETLRGALRRMRALRREHPDFDEEVAALVAIVAGAVRAAWGGDAESANPVLWLRDGLRLVPDWMSFDMHFPPAMLRPGREDEFRYGVRWWDVRQDREHCGTALHEAHPQSIALALAQALLAAAIHQMTARPLPPIEGAPPAGALL